MEIPDEHYHHLKAKAAAAGEDYEPHAKDFTVSQVHYIIDETVLTDEERVLCDLFFVHQTKAKDVSAVMDMSLRTAYKKKKELHDKLVETCKRLFLL